MRTELGVNPTAFSTPENEEARLARGDAEAFVRVYRAHVRSIYRYLYAHLGNAQDAEDTTALTFERAWASLPRYKPDGAFKSWLFTIARRTLGDYYRQKKTGNVSIKVAEELRDPALLPEEGAMVSEQLEQVLQLMRGLNRDQQDVLALRFAGEMKYEEIARIVNKRTSAVKMMAYRALEEIRRRCRDVQEE